MSVGKTASDVRKTFIDYFVSQGHTHEKASPLIPHNDPTLMFVNSGMVQFKNVFTGIEARPYTRATTSQKSVRAGGKHNDLENVGYTARHHTFFEMLGNFSFGDYFKEEAIYYAWELLTKYYGLSPSKLYATVYHDDEEAVSHWKKIAGFGDDRIIRISTNDNFWSMGDVGPCGPCSEIFYDHGDKIWGGLPGTPEGDGDRYIEIWNMVFMQFEQVNATTRIPLPKKSIDTGMGLERISAVIQGVHDNYDVDIIRDIIDESERLSGKRGEVGSDVNFSHRVIADHMRSCSFLIADGVMPANDGRGYVLRRIMRRAMRHIHQLGVRDPMMYKLLPKLISLMGDTYPELKRAEVLISEILLSEETRFRGTLDKGLHILSGEIEGAKAGDVLAGDVAFKLYDTYGFPLDLTNDILKKHSMTVDQGAFDACMEQQRQNARASWGGSGENKLSDVWFGLKEKIGTTEFLGYSAEECSANVVAILQNNESVSSVSDSECVIVTNQTVFYGESGGQVGDIGTIIVRQNDGKGIEIKVLDTKKYLGVHAHVCSIPGGVTISVGTSVEMHVNHEYRSRLRANHTATHILQKALRDVLGEHVTQKGSSVSADRLRFDMSHPKALTYAELERVEDIVNRIVLANGDVSTKIMSSEDAINSGAMALFGEKYDSEVRVVSIDGDEKSYSVELCGGTHCTRTGQIGAFKIITECAVASGVRRVEAITGLDVIKYYRGIESKLESVAEAVKSPVIEVCDKVNALVQKNKDYAKELQNLRIKRYDITSDIIFDFVDYGNTTLYYQKVAKGDEDIGFLRQVAEMHSEKSPFCVVIIYALQNDKYDLSISVGRLSQYKADVLAKELVALHGGKVIGSGERAICVRQASGYTL